MSKPPDLKPGIYGATERWISDAQLNAIAVHVWSINSIRARLLSISSNQRLEEKFVGELSQAIIDFIVPAGIKMSGGDTLEIFQLLRTMAEKEQKER